jgi:hypothetical protein
VVGTGSAVSPLNFCLSAQGYRQDRSDDRATLDGLKLSRLSSGLVYRPCPLWSFIARSASGQGHPDAPTGVPGHRDFRSASHLGGYGTLLISRRY